MASVSVLVSRFGLNLNLGLENWSRSVVVGLRVSFSYDITATTTVTAAASVDDNSCDDRIRARGDMKVRRRESVQTAMRSASEHNNASHFPPITLLAVICRSFKKQLLEPASAVSRKKLRLVRCCLHCDVDGEYYYAILQIVNW